MPQVIFHQVQQDDQPASKRPVMSAQRMELQARYNAFHDASLPTPQPGDLVTLKFEDNYLPSSEVHQYILWRMLDLSTPVDQEIVRTAAQRMNFTQVDCIVAFQQDNGDLVFVAADLRSLRHLTEDERAAL